jgi:hypothetical protein
LDGVVLAEAEFEVECRQLTASKAKSIDAWEFHKESNEFETKTSRDRDRGRLTRVEEGWGMSTYNENPVNPSSSVRQCQPSTVRLDTEVQTELPVALEYIRIHNVIRKSYSPQLLC